MNDYSDDSDNSTATLRPRLVVAGGAKAIDYYVRAFSAEETARYTAPDGGIAHAELVIGGAGLTLKDADGTDPAPGANGTSVLLSLEVDDVDAVGERMVAGGGTVVFPIRDTEYGRMGRIADPFGHVWMLSQRTAPPVDAPVDAEALTDLQTPWCVHAVASRHIVEHLDAGHTRIEDLAATSGCDAGALHNVLGHLVSKGVFAEPEPGRFAVNQAARDVFSASGFLDLNGIGGRFAHAWSTLPGYLRTGKPAYHEVFGLPFWEDLAAHQDLAAEFDELMGTTGHGIPDPDILDDWSGIGTVVDVGGGTGALLAEILRAHPGIRGTLVDFPGTVGRSGPVFADAGVADRVTLAGGSFFDPLPAGADLYVLHKVINDWPDEEAVAILRRCAEASHPGSRIVIVGGISPDGTPPRLTIEMILVGGKNNTVAEFEELARRAGLGITASGYLRSGRYAVECRPVDRPQ